MKCVSTGRTCDGSDYGLQQYCIALGGLASRLSSPSPKGLKSTLLFCQIFISIEQVLWNFAAMIRHMIQGLGNMRQYWARPAFAGHTLVPANDTQLPYLDVFIVKMFVAPCKFAEPPATADRRGRRHLEFQGRPIGRLSNLASLERLHQT